VTVPVIAPAQPRIASDDVSTLISAITENAHRLGLKWILRPGTIVTGTDPGNVTAKVDGDDIATLGIVSMVGKLNPKSRVFLLIIPTVGTYVIGRVGSIDEYQHVSHQQVTASTTSSAGYANLTNLAGAAFVAPPSGNVTLFYAAVMLNTTVGAGASLTPWVGTDSVVGAGTQVLVAADANAVRFDGTPSATFQLKSASHVRLTGLIPGRDYNLSMRGRRFASGGTATFTLIDTLIVPEH
jgi:hypothetical protein